MRVWILTRLKRAINESVLQVAIAEWVSGIPVPAVCLNNKLGKPTKFSLYLCFVLERILGPMATPVWKELNLYNARQPNRLTKFTDNKFPSFSHYFVCCFCCFKTSFLPSTLRVLFLFQGILPAGRSFWEMVTAVHLGWWRHSVQRKPGTRHSAERGVYASRRN